MTSDGPVTSWLEALEQGDSAAAQRLWNFYFTRLVSLASRRMPGGTKRVIDGEDVALSAFESFFEGVRQQRFPSLVDRDGLWRLLVTITARKAADATQQSQRQKRGGGLVRGDSAFQSESRSWDQVIGREPSPEFSCQVRDELNRLMSLLDDPTLEAIAIGKLNGWTNEEIACEQGVVPRTIERKLGLIRRVWSAEAPR